MHRTPHAARVTMSGVFVAVLLLAVLSTTGDVCADDDAARAGSLRVASLSFVPTKWDKMANAQRIEEMTRDAAAQGARLVVTSEGALEGYVVNEVIHAGDDETKQRLIGRFQELAEPTDGPYVRRFVRLADELDVFLILGLLSRADETTTFNSAVLFGPDGHVRGFYHKTHFHQGYDINPPGYTPGDKYPVFDVDAARLGMMICFDRQPPEPARALALGGANLIVCPSYGGTGEWNTRLMQVRAYENDVYVVFTHPEQSLIIAPDGELLAESSGDGITCYDVDLSKPTRNRQSIRYRRPETYQDLDKQP